MGGNQSQPNATAIIGTGKGGPLDTSAGTIASRGISFTYDHAAEPALRDITLTVPAGECIVLCGASGCGKTSYTRVANGLIPSFFHGAFAGNQTTCGLDVETVLIDRLTPLVGSVFQNPRSQFFNVDTTSEITFGCENLGQPAETIRARLERTVCDFRLEKLMDRNIFHLSGGEKQKVACAGVSIMEPEVLVLDEPSSNLDIATIEDLIGVIRHWQSEKKTVIVAEHRLYYLVPYADRILYMKHGSIVREFTGTEFQKLSPDELQGMGLRALDPFHLSPEAAPKPAAPKLHIKGFQFSYEKHGPLNVDIPALTLPQGEIIGIIGNNGAGKSTFARCLCGLDKKAKGVLEMDGASYDAKQRRHISYMVMQDVNHQLFTESTEEEMLISMEEPASDKVDAILDRLDLLQFKERHPMALSGGQKQRVAIATALVSEHKVLVLDEPTSGLDLQHMKEVADELVTIQKMGKTSLVITHDYELIVSCCTHVLHLEHGVVQEQYAMDAAGLRRLQKFFIDSR